MKKFTILLLILTSLFIGSCEKEVVINNYYGDSSIPTGLKSGDKFSEEYTDYIMKGLNQEWSYKKIEISENLIVESVICDFERPGFSTCLQDLIISWNNNSLFNYDNECQMYNTPLYINKSGSGTLKISAPTTHGVKWNKITVLYKVK